MGVEEALVVVVGGDEGGERHTLEVGGDGSSLANYPYSYWVGRERFKEVKGGDGADELVQ